VLNGDL